MTSNPQRRCPKEILALFHGDESAKAEGRRRAIEWLIKQVPEMYTGEAVLIPDPETGDLLRFIYNKRQSVH
jgi:hypothetical protein